MRLSLNSLLVYLIDRVNTEAERLFWCVLFWLAGALGSAAKMEEATADPFFFPRVVGPKGRSLKISAAFKRNVAQISAKSNVFHSPDAVLRGFDILARSGGGEQGVSANKWQEPYVRQYMHMLQMSFNMDRLLHRIYSFAWDANRLSRRDSMIIACYAPCIQVAGWCPPQASSQSMCKAFNCFIAIVDVCE